MDDVLNHQAYEDVLSCKDPSYPDDEEYMKCFDFCRQFQRYPGDEDDF